MLPILLDSLTSGFNIGANLSTELAFNDMFGFTEEEIAPILAHLGGQVSREEIRTYYNGYRFSPCLSEHAGGPPDSSPPRLFTSTGFRK